MALGLSACGHIPGYYPEDEAPRASAGPERPKAPPAPPPGARRPPDEVGEVGEVGEVDDTVEADEAGPVDDAEPVDEAPPYVPPPKPPRYTPPSTWEPPAAPARNAPTPPPVQPTPVAPPAREADTADGVKTIRLDADTYYLVDARRNLCFLRHKESMTAVDCARVVDPADTRNSPAPAPTPPSRVEPVAPAPAPAAPSRVEPAPTPATPTPDETTRFEAAFTDIFCDRKARSETPPEARIRGRGLSVERYEAIEGWWASDENAWFALTSKAARSCR